MIQTRPSADFYNHSKAEETFNAEWAHSEAKRLLLKPEYRFEEERSENIHLYEQTLIQHERHQESY